MAKKQLNNKLGYERERERVVLARPVYVPINFLTQTLFFDSVF